MHQVRHPSLASTMNDVIIFSWSKQGIVNNELYEWCHVVGSEIFLENQNYGENLANEFNLCHIYIYFRVISIIVWLNFYVYL